MSEHKHRLFEEMLCTRKAVHRSITFHLFNGLADDCVLGSPFQGDTTQDWLTFIARKGREKFHKAASLHLFDAFRRRLTIIETIQRLSKHTKTLYCLYSIYQKEIPIFYPTLYSRPSSRSKRQPPERNSRSYLNSRSCLNSRSS